MTNPAVIIPVTTHAVVCGFDDIDDNTLEESMIFLDILFKCANDSGNVGANLLLNPDPTLNKPHNRLGFYCDCALSLGVTVEE